MEKLSCQQIDDEFLVEQYIAGKLTGALRDRFEMHISECAEHAQAVSLEKVLRRGIREYARGELKSRIMSRVKKRDDIRLLVLRFAAFLLVAVITPLILYYQFGIFQKDKLPQLNVMSDSITKPLTPVSQEIKTTEISATAGVKTAAKASAKESAVEPESEGLGLSIPQSEPIMAETEEPTVAAEERQMPVDVKKETLSDVQTLGMAAAKPTQDASGLRNLMVGTRNVSDITRSKVLVFNADNILQSEMINKISPQIEQYEPEIHDCMKKYTADTANTYSHLFIEFMILPDGKTQAAKILKTNIDLNECENSILEKIHEWTFPMVDSECRVQIQYRFRTSRD